MLSFFFNSHEAEADSYVHTLYIKNFNDLLYGHQLAKEAKL